MDRGLDIPALALVKANLRKTDWSESKKETNLVALRDKKRKKNVAQIVFADPKFFEFLLIC